MFRFRSFLINGIIGIAVILVVIGVAYGLNNYGLPSYTQVNADIYYSFAGMLKGYDAQLLVVGKMKIGETYNNKKFEFNKVNMEMYILY